MKHTENNTFKKEIPKTTQIQIKNKDFSMGIFLLCFFIPIFSPIIALIRKKFIFFVVILVLFFICIGLTFIPVIGWIAIVIIDLIIASKVASGTKNINVNVSN